MRFVPVLGNHCCQTLSGVVVCPSLAISTEQIHARTTTELCRPALRTLPLQIGDKDLAVPDNRGSERWRPTCVHCPGDGKATHAGQSGMAATRGNDNVHDKLLIEKLSSKLTRFSYLWGKKFG